MKFFPPALASLVIALFEVFAPALRAGDDPGSSNAKTVLARADSWLFFQQGAAASDIPVMRTTATAALRSLWDQNIKPELSGLLRHSDPEIRRRAAERIGLGCALGDKDANDTLVRALSEENPKVLAALYLAIGRINAEGAADVLVNALSFDDGKDKDLRVGIVGAIDIAGKHGIDKLLALADSGSEKDLERVLEIYPALHSRAAGEGLIALVKNYHVGPAQKELLIRSLANYRLDPPLSFKPLARFLVGLPRPAKDADLKQMKLFVESIPVRLAALEVLSSAKQVDHGVQRDILQQMLQMRATDRLVEFVEKKGDAKRGRGLYLTNKVVACAACHRLQGNGGDSGPDLSRVWSTHSTAALLEALLMRGKKFKESYHDVAQHLSFGEILDLIAFLRDRLAQEALRGRILEFLVVGPFDGDSKATHGPEKDPALHYDSKTGRISQEGRGLGWQIHKASNDGIFDLAPHFLGPKISAYALTYIHSPKEQKADLEVHGSAVARYWFNGKKILDFAPCCDAEPAAIILHEGWNVLLVRVFATQGELALSARIISDQDVRFSARSPLAPR